MFDDDEDPQAGNLLGTVTNRVHQIRVGLWEAQPRRRKIIQFYVTKDGELSLGNKP